MAIVPIRDCTDYQIQVLASGQTVSDTAWMGLQNIKSHVNQRGAVVCTAHGERTQKLVIPFCGVQGSLEFTGTFASYHSAWLPGGYNKFSIITQFQYAPITVSPSQTVWPELRLYIEKAGTRQLILERKATVFATQTELVLISGNLNSTIIGNVGDVEKVFMVCEWDSTGGDSSAEGLTKTNPSAFWGGFMYMNAAFWRDCSGGC